jgi:hypothetical protein
MPASNSARSSRLRTSPSGWKIAMWTLPSPACPHPATSAWCSAASSPTRAMKAGMAARGTTTSMMSSAPLALPTQNAFSRASISPAAAGPGST